MKPLLNEDGPKILSVDDFKLILELAIDGALVHHRNIGAIIDKILPDDEYNMIDVEAWQKIGMTVIGVVKDIVSETNVISRGLRLVEVIKQGKRM